MTAPISSSWPYDAQVASPGHPDSRGVEPIPRASGHASRGVAPAVFVILSLTCFRISLIGELYISELILGSVLLFQVLLGGRISVERSLGIASSFLGVWLLGQVLSDMYVGTAFADYARGWARIVFTGLNLLALCILVSDNTRRIRAAFLGLILGQVLSYFVDPTTYARTEPWKFGFAYPCTTLVALLACSPIVWRRRLGPCVLFLAMAALNLMLGARSLSGICLLSGLLTLVARREPQPQLGSTRWAHTAVVVVLGVGAAIVGSHLYGTLAASGSLGADAQLKYDSQSTGQYGFLLGGRREIVFSLLAIRESPIVGHGSFAALSSELQTAAERELETLGYIYLLPPTDRLDLLPTHSHIFGAWVDAGLLALPFWLICLSILVRGCVRGLQRGHSLAALQIFVALAISWDVLFSPFGADRRVTLPLGLILLLSRERNNGSIDHA